ncbi:hypothetical protein NIES4074_40520 [Cylindrospermum sp. NIES-4074]|nr:hypothetical protein NIES4074_40520 [Cylindrospermum sp. NIES-4074]
MVYKRVQKKSSSSSPAYTNEASKSKFRQPSFGIQPQTDTDSSPQENPSYSQEPHQYRGTNALSRVVANLQRQALAEAQLSQLEPEAQADEVSNEAVEIQHQNESPESGDEDSNSADGGTIQRSCSECQSEPEEEKTSSEPPQFYTVQRQSKYLHQKTPIQAKLTIGTPGDKYEQEADSMAARVMSMDSPITHPQTIQRQGEEQHESIQQQPPISPFVQRVGELIQRMAEVKASTDETVVNSNKEPLFSAKQDNLESTQLEYLQAKHINRVNARPGTEAQYLDNRSHTETATTEESVIQPLTDETLQRSGNSDATSATPSLESRLGSQIGRISIVQPKLATEPRGQITNPIPKTIPPINGSTNLHLGAPKAQSARVALAPTKLPPVPNSVLRHTVQRRVTQKLLWQRFWQLVGKRFGVRITTAGAAAIADGPLPIGDLISAGLALWMLWDLVGNWDTYWQQTVEEVEQEQTVPQAIPREKTEQPKHRGVIQVQGDDMKKGFENLPLGLKHDKDTLSSAWAQPTPYPAATGLVALETMRLALSKKQLKVRTEAFKKANEFILRAQKSGGHPPISRTFKDPNMKNERVDIVIHTGIAFI